jgi:hypothetical protein
MTKPEAEATQICLVGGVGRSGTTLLREVFTKHPLVATFPTETRFLIDPDGLVDFYDSCSAGWSPHVYDMKLWRLERLLRAIGRAEFARGRGRPSSAIHDREPRMVVKDLVAPLRQRLKASPLLPRYFNVSLQKSCPDYPRLVEELISSLVDFRFSGRWTGFPALRPSETFIGPPGELQEVAESLGTFVRKVMHCRAAPTNATHVVEDSPFNHISFDRIIRMIPDARLVHIYRDPRDVTASLTKMGWGPSDPVDAAKLCLRIMEQWEKVKSNLPADSFTEVALESVAEAPQQTLRRLCDFWGLPWAEELLAVDVSMVNSGRWRSDLNVPDQKAVADVLEPVVKTYGYIA